MVTPYAVLISTVQQLAAAVGLNDLKWFFIISLNYPKSLPLIIFKQAADRYRRRMEDPADNIMVNSIVTK